MNRPKELEARAAFTCILGVVAGAIIAEARLTQDNNLPVMVWLAYVVTCGIVLRGGRDREWRVLLASGASPTAFVVTMGFLIFQRGHAFVTGREVTAADPEMVTLIVSLFWIVSYLGIWIFSFAHRYVLWALKEFFHLSDEMLARVDTRLKWALGLLTTLGLIAKKIF